MIALTYPIRGGAWRITLRGEWDPGLRNFDTAADCRLVTDDSLDLTMDEEVAVRILALDRGWSIHAAEERIAEDAEAEYEPPICGACNGSGEGRYDGSICRDCRGSGEERPEREVA